MRGVGAGQQIIWLGIIRIISVFFSLSNFKKAFFRQFKAY